MYLKLLVIMRFSQCSLSELLLLCCCKSFEDDRSSLCYWFELYSSVLWYFVTKIMRLF